MEHEENDPRRLFEALAEFYPLTGDEYIDALRDAGMSDGEIVADCQKHVQNAPTSNELVKAMKSRIAAVRRSESAAPGPKPE